jgi:hypothetical protein
LVHKALRGIHHPQSALAPHTIEARAHGMEGGGKSPRSNERESTGGAIRAKPIRRRQPVTGVLPVPVAKAADAPERPAGTSCAACGGARRRDRQWSSFSIRSA